MNKQSGIKRAFNIFFVFFTLLLFSKGFKYVDWVNTRGQMLTGLYVGICMLAIVITRPFDRKDHNYRLIWTLALLPLVSALLVVVLGYTTPALVRVNLQIFVAFMLYFLVSYLRVSEGQIIVAFTVFALITLVLQYVQQSILPFPMFGVGDDEVSERNDIYRYFVGSYFVAILGIFYYWCKIIKKFNVIAAILLVCMLVSLYLYLTRQLMLSVGITIFASIFLIKNRKKRSWAFVLMMIGAIVMWVNFDALFGDFIDSYQEDTFTTDIRMEFIEFLIGELLSDPFALIVGHGHTALEQRWANNLYYLSDIGFLGEMYYYGLIWIIVYIYTCYKIVVKYSHVTPLYIKLYMISCLIDSIFIFPYRDIMESFIWMIVLYISGLYINQKRDLCIIKS